MNTLKHLSVVALIVLIVGFITLYLKPNNPLIVVSSFLIAVFFIFNLITRKSLSYKNYFTNRYNLFTTKVRSEKLFDISKELMFEKIIEVINDSDFKLVDTDKDKFEILAISAITFKSWGENLYIDFEEKGNKTIMKFCSSTLFQVSSWGKNQKNYDDLLNEIESSLIV